MRRWTVVSAGIYFLVALVVANNAVAQVFMCITPTGVRYQDRPCLQDDGNISGDPKSGRKVISFAGDKNVANVEDGARVLTIDTGIRAKQHVSRKQAKKVRAQAQKRRDMQLKEVYKQSQENRREQRRFQREQKADRVRAERKQQKCELAKYRVKAMQKRLHAGYTQKQQIKITEDLDYYRYLQKVYCEK